MNPTLARALDRALGPLLSFDRLGYAVHAATFDPDDLDLDLEGRHVVITGANSGLGEAAARRLGAMGATLHLVCRSAERGEAARERVARAAGHGRVHLVQADLSEPAQVEAAARAIGEVHVLVHNAGALLDTLERNSQGLEMTVATHLVGPTLLTARLWPRLAAARGRVIFVSSGGLYGARLSARACFSPREPFDGVMAYAHAKRAQLALTRHLAARGAPLGIEVHAMHPGWAETPGVARSLPRFHRVTRAILRSPEQGADTVVWLAARPALPGPSGSFWADRRVQPQHLRPDTRHDPQEEERLIVALLEAAGLPRTEDWGDGMPLAGAPLRPGDPA